MKVNLDASTNTAKDKQMLLYKLVAEMADEWDIACNTNSMRSLAMTHQGSIEFIKWLRERKGITATYFYIPDVFNGYDIVEDEAMTAYKLTVDLTKKIPAKFV